MSHPAWIYADVEYHCGHKVAYMIDDPNAIREIEALIPLTEHGECPECREKRLRAMLTEIRISNAAAPNTPVQMHWCADKRCREAGNVKTYPMVCAGGKCGRCCGTDGGCPRCNPYYEQDMKNKAGSR